MPNAVHMYAVLKPYSKLWDTVLQFWSWIALYFVLIRKDWEQPIKLSNFFLKMWWVFSKPYTVDISQLRSKAVGLVSGPVQATPANSYSATNTYTHFFLLPRGCGGPIPWASQQKYQPSVFTLSMLYAMLVYYFFNSKFNIYFPSYLLFCSRFQFSCSLTLLCKSWELSRCCAPGNLYIQSDVSGAAGVVILRKLRFLRYHV